MIVIKSLVPGGVAQLNGTLCPGDRLLAVNQVNLENATLNNAVSALKVFRDLCLSLLYSLFFVIHCFIDDILLILLIVMTVQLHN